MQLEQIPTYRPGMISTYGQLIAFFVRQMQFDIVVPGKPFFSDDKSKSLLKQIDFYKETFRKDKMTEEQAFSYIVQVTSTVPSSEIALQELINVFIGYRMTVKLTHLETFNGTINLVDNQYYINWECYKPKLYRRTLAEIFKMVLQLASCFEFIILTIMRQSLPIHLNFTLKYNSNYLGQDIPESYTLESAIIIHVQTIKI